MSGALDSKLGKLIQLAKNGVGGERDNADRIVRRICFQQNLSYEEVMREADEVRDWLTPNFNTVAERKIIAQVLSRYAFTDVHDNIWITRDGKHFIYEATEARHVEVTYAIKVYIAAFRKELRKLALDAAKAFTMRNDLYLSSNPDYHTFIDEARFQPTDLFEDLRLSSLAEGMERVNLRRALGTGE